MTGKAKTQTSDTARPSIDGQNPGDAPHAHPVFHLMDRNSDDKMPWSARHLPVPDASRRMRYSLVAAAAGLVAVILAVAVSGPIKTSGTQMEPARFHAAAHQGKKPVRISAADVTTIRSPAVPPSHR